jgi:hypothetical protein
MTRDCGEMDLLSEGDQTDKAGAKGTAVRTGMKGDYRQAGTIKRRQQREGCAWVDEL